MSLDQFIEIKWPEGHFLPDAKARLLAIKIVGMLCRIGKVVEWLEGRASVGDLYTKMPYAYEVNGIKIRYLPHWDHIDVGRMTLPLDSTDKEILEAIELDKAGKTRPERK